MKRFVWLFLFVASAVYAENFTFDNQTSYPSSNTKMALQWASSAQEVQQENQALIQFQELRQLQYIKNANASKVTIPETTKYFRVLVWSGDDKKPDLHTNWVEISPGSKYTLTNDLLIPSVLASGTGC